MSKKKNTLKDLDEFLKQQAATLVAPEKLQGGTSEEPARALSDLSAVDNLREALKSMSNRNDDAFRQQFYDMIIDVFGSRPDTTPEDKMLINTAIYLKNGSTWKEAIRSYWRNR